MPIVGYHVLGFDRPDRRSAFNRIDTRLLHDDNHRQKVERFFAHTPHRFNLFFHNGLTVWDEHNDWLLHGRIGGYTKRDTHRTLQQDREFFLAGLPRDLTAINFVYTCNAAGKPLIPMTPWTMAHRMGHLHMLMREKIALIRMFERYTHRILLDAYRYSIPEDNWPHLCMKNPSIDTLFFHGLWKALTTSRAGREHRVNGFEYVPEWFAQYIRFGEIRFPPYVPERLSLREIYQHEHCFDTQVPDVELLVAQNDYQTDEVAEGFGNQFETILNQWRGEVIVT